METQKKLGSRDMVFGADLCARLGNNQSPFRVVLLGVRFDRDVVGDINVGGHYYRANPNGSYHGGMEVYANGHSTPVMVRVSHVVSTWQEELDRRAEQQRAAERREADRRDAHARSTLMVSSVFGAFGMDAKERWTGSSDYRAVVPAGSSAREETGLSGSINGRGEVAFRIAENAAVRLVEMLTARDNDAARHTFAELQSRIAELEQQNEKLLSRAHRAEEVVKAMRYTLLSLDGE